MLVAQLCPTLCDPMDCSPPGSSVHGISQARMLEWVAIPFSRGCSRPRDRTWSCILQADSLLSEPPGKSQLLGSFPLDPAKPTLDSWPPKLSGFKNPLKPLSAKWYLVIATAGNSHTLLTTTERKQDCPGAGVRFADSRPQALRPHAACPVVRFPTSLPRVLLSLFPSLLRIPQSLVHLPITCTP